ncbi:MAG: hypothetical protein Q9214_005634, partial [Letrouitia sp. 1 TL-2023]
ADGMGNPHKNALPRCQLRRLKEICQQLRREAFGDNDDQELLIWIDTICCPVGPKAAKDRALANMKKTYENAACVLVLDSLIQRHNADDLGVEEMSTAIFASGQILDMSQDITMQPLAFEIIMRIRSFTTILHRSIQAGDDGADLKLIHGALQNRSVSVASDEPLLIANLLGLDLEKLLAGPEETRINRLWNLMTTAPKGIPKSVLFHVGPKLKDKGYRWAPSTALSNDQLRHIIQGTEDVISQGTPSSRGLLVNLPGFKLSWPCRPLGLTDNPWSLISKDGLLYMRDARGNWYFLKRVSVPRPASDDSLSTDPLEGIVRTGGDFHVVYPEKSFLMPAVQTLVHRVRSGLIVRITGAQEREVNYVESYMHVNITCIDKAFQTMLNAAYSSVKTLSESEPVQALAAFEGNVDLQDAQYRAIYDQMEPEMRRIAQLPVNAHGLSVAKATFGENGAKLLGALIGLLFIGHYAIIEDVTEELQQWCID